jgi:hypothetical protein
MTGALVGYGSCLVPIDLDEHYVSRIGAIAQHIESHNP